MGLYPIEQAVLDRHDAGESIAKITRETGFRRATVQNIIHRFDVNLAQDARREKKLRSQSAQLGEMLRRAGGHR